MKKLKQFILCLFSVCCLFTAFNVTDIRAYSISTNDFKKKDISEKVIKHTGIGYWNNGGFFETVTKQQVGYDARTGYSKWRFRYYITHRGDSGSYIYQKIPIGLVIDGVKKATFDQTKSGNVRNTTKLWGEYTMALAPGQHKVQLADIKGGAITVVNVTANINVRIPKYTVTFVDYNGTVLKKQTVELNKNATPPSNPSLTGYTFTGWNGNYKNVKRDETVTAQYNVNKFTVNFVDYNNQLIKSQVVEYGYNASPPPNPTRTGYTFNGWNGSYTNVTSNRTIVADYRINTYIVAFHSNGGTSVPSKVVTYGDKVQEPPKPTKGTDKFMSWYMDSNLTKKFDFNTPITQNQTLYAKWDSIPVIKADDITIFEDMYTQVEWVKARKENASAQDKEDGDITSKIKVIYDNVDIKVKGHYFVIYNVMDSSGNQVNKKVNVIVLDERSQEDSMHRYIRSISKEYKNSLHNQSKWRLDESLKVMLERVWESNGIKERWTLHAYDINKIREFNAHHGYSKADNAIFMEQFAFLKN